MCFSWVTVNISTDAHQSQSKFDWCLTNIQTTLKRLSTECWPILGLLSLRREMFVFFLSQCSVKFNSFCFFLCSDPSSSEEPSSSATGSSSPAKSMTVQFWLTFNLHIEILADLQYWKHEKCTWMITVLRLWQCSFHFKCIWHFFRKALASLAKLQMCVLGLSQLNCTTI